MKLFVNALTKYICGLMLVGALIFLPAWSLHFARGWLLLGLLFGPMLIAGFVMLFKSPDFLKKRLDAKEKQATQKGVIAFSGLMFIGGFVLCGLDHRFGWSSVPMWLTIVAATLFLVGYGLYAEVMRENAYLSRTVELQEGQQLIDTGLYGIVRHPMYTATILMFLSLPLILGSLWALAVFAIYPVLMVLRIRNEEQVLSAGLAGYTDYQQRVPYRLFPWLW